MLGLGRQESETDIIALANTRFPSDVFPPTRELARFARESLGDLSRLDPDSRLDAWLKREAQLFYALEKRIVGARISRPNAFASVEEFLSFSLSVQNRRKSRMGWSLENHLDALFADAGLRFDHPGRTELNKKPDFLFPGIREYSNPAYDESLLRMVGAKATCKDRWRQVLSEASRIRTKHICTLEPAITINQTEEMRSSSIALIVPRQNFGTFAEGQRKHLLTLSEFIKSIRELGHSVRRNGRST